MIYIHDLDPILFSLGPLRVGWYGLMYALGFLAGYWLLARASRDGTAQIAADQVSPLVTYVILGVVVGGRLGWVLFYGGMPYLVSPWRILETWKGGMSFHGGLLGVLFAIWLFARNHKLPLLAVGDAVIPTIAPGLFFGRIGNFINGELFGKPTDGTWGVVFPSDAAQVPRHPSQLYEALLEGLIIFIVLQVLRIKVRRPGIQPAVFMTLYGAARIMVEFVRLPDADIGYWWGFITRGQLLSLPMVAAGLFWIGFILRQTPAVPEPGSPRKR